MVDGRSTVSVERTTGRPRRLGALLSGCWVLGRRNAAVGLLTAPPADAWTEGDGRDVQVIETVRKARSGKPSTPEIAPRRGAAGDTPASATVGVTHPESEVPMPCTRGDSWRR
jgi:hypothetical protein